ncbi:hypothetical protein G5B38_06250 [Pseudohalocynthiibacter aestuariivivens]|nr:hypothetical protein [Pseudohalocynthiibacter aestuariivivens]QIE45161.1 hypothetical protein G5B38_06250 [Pseudohalocynthiibacter aestuariivivens]
MEETQVTTVAPRDPATVMQLARMGSFHQCRLSFMRQLLRRFKSENWHFEVPMFDIDACGVGRAVYTAHGPQNSYSLVAFSHDLPPELRSDRVIATAWDATFTLFDGIPDKADLDRLEQNVPLQEAGRISEKELSLARANRSVRLWEHVLSRLAAGQQPDAQKVREVGYLMRTTAVYGSGKFGAADREATCARPEFQAPFQVEMLHVYLIRTFVMDLVEFMAHQRNPATAVPIDPALRRQFGIGNSTGLGMAPFLLNHPALLHSWINARETALARVRSLPTATKAEIDTLRHLIRRARRNAQDWVSEHPVQIDKLDALRSDLEALEAHLKDADVLTNAPWDRLWLWGEAALSLEGQEQLASLLLEPYGHLVDDLGPGMASDETAHWRIDGAMSVGQLRTITEDVYRWALDTDWSDPAAIARVWYISEAKLEPRLGERHSEPLTPYEQPLCPGRDSALMYKDLHRFGGETVAAFALHHPEHRHMVRRAQITARLPYAEIRDNTIGADLLPIDMLRAKLSFFGACHFDPRSDRWVRINMYKHAPFPAELGEAEADDWTLPPQGTSR